MLSMAHADLIERMRAGGSDEEILEWFYARGTRLNRAQSKSGLPMFGQVS